MSPIVSLPVAAQSWLLSSVLGAHIDALTEDLKDSGYAASTMRGYLSAIAHFARWISSCYLPLRLLDESTVEEFFRNHLARCDCPWPVTRVEADLRAALGHLLDVLRERGAIAPTILASGPIAEELNRYETYLRDVRGLGAGTRKGRLRIVRRLLVCSFADGPVAIAQLQPDTVRKFIADQLDLHKSASNASALASTLRSYFRYRSTCKDRVHALMGVISAPAQWNLSTLPRSLSTAQIDQLLASFTPELRSPRRGLAMVRCALDMGLRAGEIAKLQLADIDWKAGTVTLRRTKSRRQDRVPLPASTGEALAEYLRHERGSSRNPAVFVRRMAPRDKPIGTDAVRRVIGDAYRRIGLTHTRTHALRHTLARRLLEHGSSLKEVADVLRHRSLNTTLIYAKLDTSRLSAVALPWPGSES